MLGERKAAKGGEEWGAREAGLRSTRGAFTVMRLGTAQGTGVDRRGLGASGGSSRSVS